MKRKFLSSIKQEEWKALPAGVAPSTFTTLISLS